VVSRAIFALAAGLVAASGSPALAGWFDSKPAAPAAAPSVDYTPQIQKDIDDQQYLDAGKLLDQALLADGENPKLTLLAGELSLANGHYDLALASFQSIDAKPEQRARALEGEGIALSMLGKSDAALAALKSAVAADDSLWRAWNALGTEYDRRHDWTNAEGAYSHAISIPSSTAIVLNPFSFTR